MNSEGQTVEGDDQVTVRTSEDPGQPGNQAQSRLKRLRLLFRGKYIWFCLLVAAFAVVGSFIGYRRVELLYRSEGMIRIKPYVIRILYELEDNGVMPLFNEFVGNQIALMQSPRVRDKAAEALGRPFTPEAQEEFGTSLRVKRDRGSQMIRVSFTDPVPKAAQAAVKAVIEAYMRIYGQRDTEDQTRRLRLLNERKTMLTNMVNARRDSIFEIAREYGSEGLAEMFAFKLQERQKLEVDLKEKQRALAGKGRAARELAAAEGTEEQQQAVDPVPAELSVDEIVRVDAGMRARVAERERAQTDLTILRKQGLRDNHRKVVPLLARLEVLDKQIERSAKSFNERWTSLDPSEKRRLLGLSRAAANSAPDAETDIQTLTQQIQQLRRLYDEVDAETIALGRQNIVIARLKEEAGRSEAQLRETVTRIEQLNVESAVSGRIDVISDGGTPFFPINAGKRKQSTLLGAAAGGALGVGLILIIGLLVVSTPPSPARHEGALFATEPQAMDAVQADCDGSADDPDRHGDP